jgi:hypothetical protein
VDSAQRVERFERVRGVDSADAEAATIHRTELSRSTRNIIASAKMEGVDLSDQTIADLKAVEAGTKTAEQAIAEYIEQRAPVARR